MVCTKFHSCIDTLYGCNALSIDADCFVYHRDEDTVNYETSCLFYLNRCFTDFLGDLLNCFYVLRFCVKACDNLYKLHNRCRVEEVHTNYISLYCRADLCDRKGRCICSEDTLRFADLIKLFESLFFDRHVLDCSFYNEIAICTDFFCTCCDLSQDAVSSFLCHFSFCYHFFKCFSNSIFTICGKCLINIAEHYLIAFCLCECLCDTGTHGSCTNNTNFHGYSS